MGGQFQKPLAERFAKRWLGEPNSGCWLWMGGMLLNGYGYFNLEPPVYRKMLAHRQSWELHEGPIPNGMCVLHKCDTRCCVNPSHLFLGTAKDNSNDKISKGRGNNPKGTAASATKLTEEQVLSIYSDPRTRRAIAASYGVKHGTVNAIKAGRTWGHITQKREM